MYQVLSPPPLEGPEYEAIITHQEALRSNLVRIMRELECSGQQSTAKYRIIILHGQLQMVNLETVGVDTEFTH